MLSSLKKKFVEHYPQIKGGYTATYTRDGYPQLLPPLGKNIFTRADTRTDEVFPRHHHVT